MSPPPGPATRGRCAGDDADRHDADPWGRRMRLERELHDGPALRLSAATLRLGLLRHRVDDPALRASLLAVQDDLHAVLEELRDVAGTLYPPLLLAAGLGPAVLRLAEDLAVSVAVEVPAERHGPALEGAVYFALAEGLRATTAPEVAVRVTTRPAGLVCRVTGLDATAAGRLRARACALGAATDPPAAPAEPAAAGVTAVFPCG